MISAHCIHRRFRQVKEQYFDLFADITSREKIANGHYVEQVERHLAKIYQRNRVLLTSSGSSSLLLSLMARNIGHGDQVIVTNYGPPACVSYVRLIGAEPVFCELNETGCMDANLLESLVTDKTKAIVATGLYGDMFDHDTVQTVCKKFNLFYIHDAAQSALGSYKNKLNTSLGEIACMSFAENKPIPSFSICGAIAVDSPDVYKKLISLRKHGKPTRTSKFTQIGINAWPEENKAIQILCSLPHIDTWQKRREEIVNYYDTEFNKLGITVRPRSSFTKWNTHKYCVLFEDKFVAQKQLEVYNIETEACYPDNFAANVNYQFTEKFVKQSLCIPINAHLTDAEVETVVQKVSSVWKNNNI